MHCLDKCKICLESLYYFEHKKLRFCYICRKKVQIVRDRQSVCAGPKRPRLTWKFLKGQKDVFATPHTLLYEEGSKLPPRALPFRHHWFLKNFWSSEFTSMHGIAIFEDAYQKHIAAVRWLLQFRITFKFTLP